MSIPKLNPATSVNLILARSNEMAVLPHVVNKVLELTSSEDASARDLERAIQVDPGFCSRVLQLANSAAFGLPKRVTTIREAIMFLGNRTVRSIALTVGLFDVFVGKTDMESIRRREWWRHSVDTAICCRALSTTLNKLSTEEAYTSGLLHLIGKMMLDRYGGRNYLLVQKLMECGVSELRAETEVYGCDHCQVGAEAAKRWELPLSLQSSMYYLYPADPSDPNARMRACVLVGSKMAERAKMGSGGEEITCPKWALEAMNMAGVTMPELGARGRRAITEAELKI